MPNVLVVGSQRSGTTMLNRILNMNPDVGMVYQQTDYLREGFEAGELFEAKDAVEVVSHVQARTTLYDPAFSADCLQELINTLKQRERVGAGELYDLLLRQIVGPRKQPIVVGEKYAGRSSEVFLFAEYFPDGKIIQIVRDPRDVMASEKQRVKAYNEKIGRPSHLLTVYDWKVGLQTVALFMKSERDVLRVRYEDLVQYPEAETHRIWDYLDVKDYDISTTTDLVNDAGDVWTANSSFEVGVRGINATMTRRWLNELTEDELVFLRAFVAAEIDEMGYANDWPALGASSRLEKSHDLLTAMSEEVELNKTAPYANVLVPPRFADALSAESILRFGDH